MVGLDSDVDHDVFDGDAEDVRYFGSDLAGTDYVASDEELSADEDAVWFGHTSTVTKSCRTALVPGMFGFRHCLHALDHLRRPPARGKNP
jgi:hypothetical protein